MGLQIQMRILKSSLSIICLMLFFACKHDPTEPEPLPSANNDDGGGGNNLAKVSFQNHVLPIFQTSCATSFCHDANTAQSGLNLSSYVSVMNSGEVDEGRPENSDVYKRLVTTNQALLMPQGGPRLPQGKIDTIRTWILEGAKNN